MEPMPLNLLCEEHQVQSLLTKWKIIFSVLKEFSPWKLQALYRYWSQWRWTIFVKCISSKLDLEQISKILSYWRRCEDQLVRASTSMKTRDPIYPLAFSWARDMAWCGDLGSFMAIYSRNLTLRKGFPDIPTHWIVWLSLGRGCHGLEHNLCSFK